MYRKQITDHANGLSQFIDRINALALQLHIDFGVDYHKTRYLRCTVVKFDWAQLPWYTFSQFIISLQESLRIKEEMSRAGALETDYGQ